MAKFYGKIGYALPKETVPGVWVDEVIEKNYTGELVNVSHSWQKNSDDQDHNVSETISLIADGFMLDNLHGMKYVYWRNEKWLISNFEVNRPRVIIRIGGLYSGKQTEPA